MHNAITSTATPESVIEPYAIDVTEQTIRDLQIGCPAHLRGLLPAPRVTSLGRSVLDAVHGMRLGFVSHAVVYGAPLDRWPKRRHKTLLRLLLGGHVRVLRVPGPLPGEHPPSRVGAHADHHYLLIAK